jgi:Ca-activated chloride channel family protein
MAALAESSDANYYYVQDTEKLPAIFAKELGEMLEVAARDVRIEITCPDGVTPLGLIGRPEKFKGQQVGVNLSQLTAGQTRFILLRCRVSGGQPEIAHVKVSYTDEFNGGAAQTADDLAKVSFTDDQSASDKSLDGAVVAQKELVLTAVAKDEAIVQADAGNYKQAAKILSAQNSALNQAYAAAPVAMQMQIRSETVNVTNFYRDLDQGQYGNGSRKAMQSQSWEMRNSK